MMNYSLSQRGFTLVEAVIVIAIAGIVASMVAVFITSPIEGYADLSRRAELVDLSEQALNRMQRDVRQALPNSVRIKTLGAGNGQVIEFINVKAGGRYRKDPGGGGFSAADCRLAFTPVDDNSFAVMGELDTTLVAGDRLVVSNWNAIGGMANAYAGDNITGSGITLSYDPTGGANCNEPTISLSGNFEFLYESPQQRFYIVDTPVSYLCDINAGNLRRYQGYAIQSSQDSVDTAAELGALANSDALVVDGVTACNFSYDPGTPSRSGLVTVSIAVTREAENIFLQQQFHVNNIP